MKVTSDGVGSIICSANCIFCGKIHAVKVPRKEYFNWSIKGILIQDAMPSVSVDDREFLISNICSKCFPEEE